MFINEVITSERRFPKGSYTSVDQTMYDTPIGSGDEEYKKGKRNPDFSIQHQLRKAVNLDGTHDVFFSNGDVIKVDRNTAIAVLKKLDRFKKPLEKLKAIEFIQASHKNMMQFINKNESINEDMPEMAPVYPNIKSGINDAYSSIDEIDYAIARLQKTIAEEYGDDIPDEYQEPLDFIIDIMDKKLPSALRHIADIAKGDEVYESINEDLRAWFGKGKKGGAGGGGWDRYNTKGERIGKCGDAKPGEGKPKCLSKSRAAALRNADADGDGKKDGKAGIARAVKRKKSKDPNPNRRGKAKNVSNKAK